MLVEPESVYRETMVVAAAEVTAVAAAAELSEETVEYGDAQEDMEVAD